MKRNAFTLKTKSFLNNLWRENRKLLLFFVFVLVPVKSVLADWNWVPSGSMNPTILEGDLVFVNKAAYDLRVPLTLKRLSQHADPERGDVIVFFSPEPSRTRIVKRVIGLPGDTIEMKNNRLLLNGEALQYTPLPADTTQDLNLPLKNASLFAEEQLPGQRHPVMSTPTIGAQTNLSNIAPITVPEGQYYIIGDNRDNSHDSRTFGPVDRSLIVGKANRVIVSFDMLTNYLPRFSRFFTELK